jgi:hypothetical protein
LHGRHADESFILNDQNNRSSRQKAVPPLESLAAVPSPADLTM